MHRTARLFVGFLVIAHLAGAEVSPARERLVTRVEVSLSAAQHNAHVAWLPARGRLFELRIWPTFDAWGDVDSWEVQLFSGAATGDDRPNLLAPAGNWHGLQAFDVLPGDVTGSGVYPPRRVIERPEFTCTIEILGGAAKPSRGAPGGMIFDSLRLAVEVALKRSASSASDAKSNEETW